MTKPRVSVEQIVVYRRRDVDVKHEGRLASSGLGWRSELLSREALSTGLEQTSHCCSNGSLMLLRQLQARCFDKSAFLGYNRSKQHNAISALASPHLGNGGTGFLG